MKHKILFILVLFFITKVNGQSVVINEFMAKNSTTIQDKDGDFSDWIELYNPGNSIINLLNYKLSDDADELDKWVFPEVIILPHSYLLIFASKKDISDVTELHTNFKISGDGEALFLTNASGNLIDQTNAIALSDDESYCRIPDGSENWIATHISTPNGSNNYANELVFSNQEGFYSESFSLSINSITGDTIYYTLNGDIPTPNSTCFTAPLLIEDKSSEPNVFAEIPTSPSQDLIYCKAWESPGHPIDKATILRCASYRNGVRTSAIYTKSYFVSPNIFNKYSMPVISLITETEHLFGNDSGLYVPGVHFNIDNSQSSGNYFMRGKDWERKVHIEYFEPQGTLGFSQDAGVRIHGGQTRHAAQKSLRLYARTEYGKKYFNYPLLPHRPVDKYKRFLLRSAIRGMFPQTIIKDVLAQNITSSLGLDYQEFQPAIVFINGEYWGIHTIRDRIDERYIEYTRHIDKDSVEIRKYGYMPDVTNFIENNSLEYDDNYNYVTTKIDIDNYIDYTIAELFFNNYDWPGNNVLSWRKIPDGKWKWIFYDIDEGFRDENYNMFLHATANDSSVTWPNPPHSTFLFRNLLKNETFKSKLIKRYAEILNTDFDSQRMLNKLDSIKNLYSPEIANQIDRWHYPNNTNQWEIDVNRVLSFIKNRPCIIKENIMSFFELSNFDFNCNDYINEYPKSEYFLLAPNPNNGIFFISNIGLNITNATVTITNINGQEMYEETGIDIKPYEKKYFDVSNLSNGIYVLQITSNNFLAKKKIIITK